MKYIQCKVYGITDDKMLDCFIHGLEPIIGRGVLKRNLLMLEEACVPAEGILQLVNLVGGGSIQSK